MATEARRLLIDLARTVPAILLLVGTSGKAVASIKCARELFAGKKWSFNDSDGPDTPPPNADRGGNGSVGGEPVDGDDPSQRWRRTLDATSTCGSQAQASGVSLDNGGCCADVLARSLDTGEGHLPVAFREITRLVSVHAKAGHVFVNCAARLGLQPDDDNEDNRGSGAARNGLQPHRATRWKRWVDLREAAVCHSATPTTRFWR